MLIGPLNSLEIQDMLEKVLFFECVRRDETAVGCLAREVEKLLCHAYALGMQDENELAVFIHNTTFAGATPPGISA